MVAQGQTSRRNDECGAEQRRRPCGVSLFAILTLLALATAARGDVVRILDADREAAQARVDIIQQARFEIDAVYFLARNDRITLTALALLRDARRRGVTTRLIVDAAFQHIPMPLLAHLKREGVQIRVYHPFTLRHPTWTLRRMHEKFVVVDGERYITGGRNLAADYFGLERRNFVDRDAYVEGRSAQEVQQHFEELWASREVADLHVSAAREERNDAAQLLDATLANLRLGGGFVTLDSDRDWTRNCHESDSVVFLHDPVASQEGRRVGAQVSDLLAAATCSIVVESPYVIPSPAVLEVLEKKSQQGIHVEIITNSLRSTDGVLPYVGYLKYRRRLVRNGVKIHEFKGPDTLHSKSIVIDEHVALIGSYNLDQRSHNLNAEVMCVADDPRLARELLDSIDRDAAKSLTVRIRVHRLKSLYMKTIRLLLPFIEGQL